jgi:hypothetical protein
MWVRLTEQIETVFADVSFVFSRVSPIYRLADQRDRSLFFIYPQKS